MKKITTGLVLVVLACLAAAFGAGFAIYLRPAGATRNSSGTYSIPNTFTAGTTISSSSVNSNFSDLGTEMTNSLERNGKGGMLAALRGIDGTLAAPAFSWTSETGSGLFRNAASDVRMSISGALVGQWTANGYRTANGVVATPSYSFANETGTGWYRNAAGDIRFAVSGVDKQFSNATGFGIGVAPATNLLEISGATEPALSIKNTTMTNSPAFTIGMNNGNTAAIFQTVSATNYGYKFFNGAGTNLLTIGATGGLTVSSPGFATGIPNDGSGFKHQSVAGCTTAAAVGATCPSTLTWTTTFADANYHAFCGCNGTTGVPVVASYSVSAASVAITTAALTAVAATCTNISCVAVHN